MMALKKSIIQKERKEKQTAVANGIQNVHNSVRNFHCQRITETTEIQLIVNKAKQNSKQYRTYSN